MNHLPNTTADDAGMEYDIVPGNDFSISFSQAENQWACANASRV